MRPGRGRLPGADPAASGLGGRGVQAPSSLPPSLLSLLYVPVPLALGGGGTSLCSSQRECPLAADELRTVQTSLLELVQELLVRGSLAEDLPVVLSFLAAAGDAGLVGWGQLVTGQRRGGRPRGETLPSMSLCAPRCWAP